MFGKKKKIEESEEMELLEKLSLIHICCTERCCFRI